MMGGCPYRITVASLGGEEIVGLIIYATNGQSRHKLGHWTEVTRPTEKTALAGCATFRTLFTCCAKYFP
jgi:hypothetical protein